MRKIGTKKKVKQIICIIVVIMICNFIIPNYSFAVQTDGGGSLVKVISQFACFIPDTVIEFLQDMFVTPEKIKVSEDNYKIQYSPGIIFSGEVPAFDINFINPREDKIATRTKTEYMSLIEALNYNGAKKVAEKKYATVFNPFITKKSCIKDIKEDPQYEYDESKEINIELLEGIIKSTEFVESGGLFAGQVWNSTDNTLMNAWFNNDDSKLYIIVDYYKLEQISTITSVSYITTGIIYLYEVDKKETLEGATGITGTITEITDETKTYKSLASILQNTIATWYNTLKRIALVGLLSAFVYIGIRIVLTSTSAKEKAKYKNMLKDWLVALCLLFTLHYIMNITITVVENINEVFKASVVGAEGEDVLMSTVRDYIAKGDEWGFVIPYLVIYCVLAVYTITFTIQYLRRTIYLAFLTMIAPLITLTYPLDKIKDKKSQAFDMWLKDYIFFTLLQVLHLLIYYVFLGSSLDLTNQGNWIFGVVAIGFITQAEKIMKKMFGFEKSKTLGAVAAGATGALVMNAINQFKGMASKGGKSKSSEESSSSGGSSSSNVRTATTNSLASLISQNTTTENGSEDGNQMPRTSNRGNFDLGDSNGNSEPGASNGGGTSSGSSRRNNNVNQGSKRGENSQQNQNNNSSTRGISNSSRRKRNVLNGVQAVSGRYFAPAAKGTLGVLLGGSAAIIGFSAGVAQGDAGKAFAGLTAGAIAGSTLANKTVDTVQKLSKNIPETAHDVADTFRKGAYGEEYANNVKFDREFRNSNAYIELKRTSEFTETEFDKKVSQMLDAGITDTKRMKKILKNHKKHPRKYSMDKAIAYSTIAEKCPENILYNNVKFIRFCQNHDIEISEEELKNLRKCIIDFK